MLNRKVTEINERRAQSDPLPTVAAALTSAQNFKAKTSKPMARDWKHHFSIEALQQSPSPLKDAPRGITHPDLISLGAGRPNPQYFPWDALNMRNPPDGMASKVQTQLGVPHLLACTIGEASYNLSLALDYGYPGGSPQCLRFMTEHMEIVHSPLYEDWDCCLTGGATIGIEAALRTFCNPRDWLIVEEHTYPGIIAASKSQGLNLLGIEADGFGLSANNLAENLRNWDYTKGRRPKILYTVPSGQNPTGATQDEERRQAIYKIAEEYDLFILEDDPYYFLNLATASTDSDDYLASLPTSYLSRDVSGRVLRIDTLSKILAPGLRIGWITGSAQVIKKLLGYAEMTVGAPNGLSQAMAYKLLDESWGHEGFTAWLVQLSREYRQRRDLFIQACQRNLPTSICRWEIPITGMFLWLQVLLNGHPLGMKNDLLSPSFALEVEDRIYKNALECGVLVSKGSWFDIANAPRDRIFFRLTFATATEVDMHRAVARFGQAIAKEYEVK